MALEPNTVIPAVFGFVDNNNKPSSTSLYLDPLIALGDMDAYVTSLATAMDALSNAGLNVASWSRGFFDSAIIPGALPAESEVERKLALVFGTSNRYVDVTLEIPSPIFTLEADNTDEVDISNPLIQALADLVINGPVGFENAAVAASGLPILTLKRAYFKHRTRRPRR